MVFTLLPLLTSFAVAVMKLMKIVHALVMAVRASVLHAIPSGSAFLIILVDPASAQYS
jgi:hypothetical protein